MMRMIAAVRPQRPEFSFLTGWDAALAPLLMIGCNGGTNATSGVVPELTRALSIWAQHSQWDRAMQLQYRLLPLFDAMIQQPNFPKVFAAEPSHVVGILAKVVSHFTGANANSSKNAAACTRISSTESLLTSFPRPVLKLALPWRPAMTSLRKSCVK